MDLAKQHVVLCMNYYPKNDYWFSLELEKHGVDYTIVGIPESQRAFFYKGILGNIYQNLYNLKYATIIQYTIKGRFMSRE